MHDITFLWAHPRSVSSALERVMFERGDMTVLHEPFIHLYYLGDAVKTLKYFDPDPLHPTSYTGIRELVLAAAERGPVFVKDMSYYVARYIHDDEAFVRRVRNTFLIRSPEKSIPSYYRLDDEVTLEEVGLETQFRHFDLVRRVTGEIPFVLDADDVQADTGAAMRLYCDAMGIEFLPHSLNWDTPVPPEWEFVAGWHGDMRGKSAIGDSESGRTREAVTLDTAPKLRQFYDHHLPFYELLKAHCVSG